MANFEDFHVVVRKEASERIAALLRGAGVRIQERVIAEVGHPEYVIAVAVEDIGRAEEVLRQDTGAGRTFTSGAKPLYGHIRMNKDSDSGRVAGDDGAS